MVLEFLRPNLAFVSTSKNIFNVLRNSVAYIAYNILSFILPLFLRNLLEIKRKTIGQFTNDFPKQVTRPYQSSFVSIQCDTSTERRYKSSVQDTQQS